MLSRDQTHMGGEASVHRTRFIQPQANMAPPGPEDLSPVPVSFPQPIRPARSLDLPVLGPSPSPSWSSAPGRANKNFLSPISIIALPHLGVQETGKWGTGLTRGQVLDTESELESKYHRAEPWGRIKGSQPLILPTTSYSPSPIH